MMPAKSIACSPPAAPSAAAGLPLQVGMVIGSIAHAAGGVSQVLRSLTDALLQRTDTAVEVFSLAANGISGDDGWPGVAVHLHAMRGPASFGYAPTLLPDLGKRPLQMLHLHGLWMYCSVATQRWTARTGKPCLISPHGMLDPWALANSGWKKRVARRLYEDANLRHAACVHALCEPERKAIRDFGFTGPVCVIPNGVEPAPESAVPDWRCGLDREAKVLLYLGRLHPKKRVLELIQAWYDATLSEGQVASRWRLIIAGTGPTEYVQQLQGCILEFGLSDRVQLIGPQYGDAKWATFAAADAFILPSLSEGLPMAALEAWAQGLPALLSPYCNLPVGFAVGAALSIEPEPGGIAAGLRTLFNMPDDATRTMGCIGRNLVRNRFTWSRVADEFHSVYGWLLGKEEQPDCITFG